MQIQVSEHAPVRHGVKDRAIAIVAVILIAIAMGIAIAWRISERPGAPSLPPILVWQFLVWLPWIGFFVFIGRICARFPLAGGPIRGNLGVHLLCAALIAFTHLGWFWAISSLASPLSDMAGTKYGAFAFFFVFWVLIDFLLYAAVVMASTVKQQIPLAQSRLEPDPATQTFIRQFTVRKGRDRHVVRVEDIRWIEAQGYYAELHTDSASYLIRKSLTQLEAELDPACFVRIHRSTIVNVGDVKNFHSDNRGTMTIVLSGGQRRRVSRAGRARLRPHFPPSQSLR